MEWVGLEWSESERALWCAVILQAFLDVMGMNYDVCRSSRNLRSELALGWLCSERGDLGSFEWICDALKLDSSSLRNSLWQTQGFFHHSVQGCKVKDER